MLLVASSDIELKEVTAKVPKGLVYLIPINAFKTDLNLPNVKVMSSYLPSISLPDRSVDAIICSYSLEKSPEGGIIEKEFTRILKEKAKCYVANAGKDKCCKSSKCESKCGEKKSCKKGCNGKEGEKD